MGEKSKSVKSKETDDTDDTDVTEDGAAGLPKAKVQSTRAQASGLMAWTASPLVLLGLGVVGLILILFVHSFRMTPSVLFLSMGWVSILGAGGLLWHAALLLAAGEDEHDKSFVVAKTRRQELLTEKASLLKAIKEIEFDFQMGKLSDTDAAQITDVYRTRAIVILKELDSTTNTYVPDETLTVLERIERDIRARAEVAKAGRKAADKARALAKKRRALAAADTSEEPDEQSEANEPEEASEKDDAKSEPSAPIADEVVRAEEEE